MDNYRKLKVIGKGSFGCAVLVQSSADRNHYIMKIIDVSRMDKKQKEEALNEVTFLKALKHPFIISYRESFMDKNRYLCIVMDYADGGDLYNKIAKQKKLGKGFPEGQILDWFVQICLALKYVHDKKILHRDLKSQNIFLSANDEMIKIGDFGIARVLQNTYDCAQTAIGTPYYLSPEICQEKPYNQKSDIWSLGCILYELVTLKHAFDASSIKGLVLKILRGSYPAIPSNYSQELKDLISDMLIKDPHKRPSIKKILERPFLESRIPKLLAKLTASSTKQEIINNLLKNPEYESGEGNASHGLLNQMKLTPSPKTKENEISASAYPLKTHHEREPSVEGRSYLKEYDANLPSHSTKKEKEGHSRKPSLGQLPDLGNRNNSCTNLAAAANKDQVSSLGKLKENPVPNKSDYLQQLQQKDIQLKKRGDHSEERRDSFPSLSNGKEYLPKAPEDSSTITARRIEAAKPEERKVATPLKYNMQQESKGSSPFSFKKPQPNPNEMRRASKEENEVYFAEREDQRVYAKFLNIIPGLTEKDSLSYKIEALRFYLEKKIGEEAFYQSYQFINTNLAKDNDDDSKTNPELVKLIGMKNLKYITLIYHLIVCEEEFYSN